MIDLQCLPWALCRGDTVRVLCNCLSSVYHAEHRFGAERGRKLSSVCLATVGLFSEELGVEMLLLPGYLVRLGLLSSLPLPSRERGRVITVSTSPRPCKHLPGRQASGNRELSSFSSKTAMSINIHFPEGHTSTRELTSGSGSKERCSVNAAPWHQARAAFPGWQGSRWESLAPAGSHCHVREQKV